MADQEKSLTTEELVIARKYDLTGKIISFLDRHLIYPLFEALESSEIYDQTTILQLKYDLLKDTNMADYIINLWENLHPSEPLPVEISSKRDKVYANLEKLEKETQKTLEILTKQEVISNLKQDKSYNLKFLEKEYEIKSENIDALYEFGQFQYNCGNYGPAADLLSNFRVLSANSDLNASATWGKLASEILLVNWDAALDELQKLRDIIDTRSVSFADPLTQLHQRTWIIHWSLFPFFNTDSNGRDALCDLFFSSSYMSTIQAACPWIIRYLTAAVVATSSKSHSSQTFQKRLKDLIRVVGQERYEYQDPLTEFIQTLYIDFDFEAAQAKLAEAESVLRTDFFLSNIADLFLESARHLISEVYCRIHKRMDLNQLSASLNLTREQGEKWIANLIRDSKMDAKIDESEGTVIMNHPVTSVYQQVIEKTKGLSFRSNQVLTQTLSKQEAV